MCIIWSPPWGCKNQKFLWTISLDVVQLSWLVLDLPRSRKLSSTTEPTVAPSTKGSRAVPYHSSTHHSTNLQDPVSLSMSSRPMRSNRDHTLVGPLEDPLDHRKKRTIADIQCEEAPLSSLLRTTVNPSFWTTCYHLLCHYLEVVHNPCKLHLSHNKTAGHWNSIEIIQRNFCGTLRMLNSALTQLASQMLQRLWGNMLIS